MFTSRLFEQKQLTPSDSTFTNDAQDIPKEIDKELADVFSSIHLGITQSKNPKIDDISFVYERTETQIIEEMEPRMGRRI